MSSKNFSVVLMATMILLGFAVVGTSAFTTVSMDRSASVDVVSDSNGIIALEPGDADDTGGVVSLNDSDALTIDFEPSVGVGVNPEATYELGTVNPGEGSTPTSYAFNITNQDDESHTISLDYTLDDDTLDGADSTSNIKFHVYDDNGGSEGTLTEDSAQALELPSATSGETYYVVMVVDTSGLDSGDDLSGTLTVNA
ncbi:MAG: hypothetical protein ACQETI_00255 [Halobacteriota archaeon]